ncbi:MAG: hypothetical protein U0Q11_05525 [Vicinamibacterales bacterium]
MQRFVLAVIVALLTFSASGAATLLVVEPCSAYDLSGKDGTCPPTCVTCGCCAQAIEPVALVVPTMPEQSSGDAVAPPARQPLTASSDVLHVPKRVRA